MKLKYFAWIRERTGIAEENVDLPAEIATGTDLIAWLSGRGENYRAAFEEPAVIRLAYDQLHVGHEAALSGVSEIAVFPPMTGG